MMIPLAVCDGSDDFFFRCDEVESDEVTAWYS